MENLSIGEAAIGAVNAAASSTDDPSTMPSADDLRRAANGRFAANAFDEALPLYSMAVDAARAVRQGLVPLGGNESLDGAEEEAHEAAGQELVIHLCNRSACLLRMEIYDEARNDALEAVEISGGRYAKASFRLARAQMAMGENKSSIGTLEAALKQLPEPADTSEEKEGKDGADEEEGNKNADIIALQRKEFQKLLAQSERRLKASPNGPSKPAEPVEVKSIKLEPRTPSVREFIRPKQSDDSYRPLGEGNFSTVVIAEHSKTGEKFALKIIEKEKCVKLAKRQHPNVHNEVKMERRILRERLPDNPNVIKCYHAMQDYGALYFLVDLHASVHGDLWGTIRYRQKMVGCHPSLIGTYLSEVLDALEHCHKHGVVHRDLKPENVLLSDDGGHCILIDFGTAKDLVLTDLNGPEFVGTPDFMSPEAVREFDKTGPGCDFAADLWAFGVLAYQLYCGSLPFEAASPYMTFLKIQRGMFGRNMGIVDDDAWNLIRSLLKVDPKKRLGAGQFEWTPPPTGAKDNNLDKDDKDEGKDEGAGDDAPSNNGDDAAQVLGRVVMHGNGYDIIRKNPYFEKRGIDGETSTATKKQSIPSLRDLCIRAAADLVKNDSLDLDVDENHPPGDGSSHDPLRLRPADRRGVMHLLDRLKQLPEPRIYRRFFKSKMDARLGRVRFESRDCIGLTQMNDKQGQFNSGGEEEQDRKKTNAGPEKVIIFHVTNPLFVRSINEGCTDEATRKGYTRDLKESIRLVNRQRPDIVVACGYFDESCRKILSKVNETVPVILNDGSSFFNFWIHGAHCLALRSADLVAPKTNGDARPGEQAAWLRMELEQIKTGRSHGYIFVDCDPRELPKEWLRKIGKSSVLGVLGLCTSSISEEEMSFETTFECGQSGAETRVFGAGAESFLQKPNKDEDEISVSSADSDDEDEEPEEHSMHLVGRRENGVRCIMVNEEDVVWESELKL